MTNLNKLTKLLLAGNKISDYSYVSGYFNDLEVRDFTLVTDVTGVKLNLKTLKLKWPIGRKGKLVATVLPENATNKNIKWTSESNVFTVDKNGKVTAHRTGTGNIKVFTEENEFTVICTVNVTPLIPLGFLFTIVPVVIVVYEFIRRRNKKKEKVNL